MAKQKVIIKLEGTIGDIWLIELNGWLRRSFTVWEFKKFKKFKRFQMVYCSMVVYVVWSLGFVVGSFMGLTFVFGWMV